MPAHHRSHRRSLISRIRRWFGLSHDTRHRQKKSGVPGLSPDQLVVLPAGSMPDNTTGGQSQTKAATPPKSRQQHSHHRGWMHRLRHLYRKLRGKSKKLVGDTTGIAGAASPEEVFERLQQGLPVGQKKEERHHRSLTRRIFSFFRRLNPFSKRKKSIHHHRRRSGKVLRNSRDKNLFRRWFRKHRKNHDARQGLQPSKNKEKLSVSSAWHWIRTELSGYLLKLGVSMGLFMAAYIITWFTYSFAVMFIASFFDIHAVLHFYEVRWTIGNTSPLWTELNIIAITFSGPLASIIMGLVYYAILKKWKNPGTLLRTFVFWLFVLSMAHFLGAFVAGAITWQGFGYVIDWVGMHIFFRILISLIFLASMAWIGWLHAGFMLETRTLRFKPADIPHLLINRMVLPYVLGTLFLIIIKIPNSAPQHPTIWDYDVMIIASVLFAVVPPLFNKKLKPPTRLPKKTTHRRRRIIAYTAIAASVALVLLYRIGLCDGLYVFMKFVVNVAPYK